MINCRYQSEQGSYCLSMPIASEESRLYNGRDIFGFPKKMAAIHLEKNEEQICGWVERHGIRFLEIKAQMSDTISFLSKIIKRSTWKKPSGLPTVQKNVSAKKWRAGKLSASSPTRPR